MTGPVRSQGRGPITPAPWAGIDGFDAVLARHGLTAAAEEPLPNDGWSGARLSRVRRDDATFVIKRDSLRWDWIARATADGPVLREAWFAARGPAMPPPIWPPYVGAGIDRTTDSADRASGTGGDRASGTTGVISALLMPDLTGILLPWEEPVDRTTLERVLTAIVALHERRWPSELSTEGLWCPLRERLTLLSRPAAVRYQAEGNPVGARFLAGWDAFDQHAGSLARDLVNGLAVDPAPLIAALGRLPSTLLHGDLKLANVGIHPDGRLALIDWQMVTMAPVAVELGWFLVSNVPSLPLLPDAVLERYRAAVLGTGGDRVRGERTATPGPSSAEDHSEWEAQRDLAWIVGLLLRGWRKGLDVEVGARYPSGATADEDLALWCRRALEAADRRL